MRTIFTLLVFSALSFRLSAQTEFSLPAKIETEEEVATYGQFGNTGDPLATLVLSQNPDNSGPNYADNCLMFDIMDDAEGWAGIYSDAYGEMPITESDYIFEVLIYKTVLSSVGLKLENDAGEMNEVFVSSNNEVGEWEVLEFDFTEAIGKTFTRVVIMPDFISNRESGTTVLIGQIGFKGTLDLEDPNTTSINEIFKSTLNVYPNPSNGLVSIEQAGLNKITISNPLGQVVKVCEIGGLNNKTIDISGLENGMYIISSVFDNKVLSNRLIKK